MAVPSVNRIHTIRMVLIPKFHTVVLYRNQTDKHIIALAHLFGKFLYSGVHIVQLHPRAQTDKGHIAVSTSPSPVSQ